MPPPQVHIELLARWRNSPLPFSQARHASRVVQDVKPLLQTCGVFEREPEKEYVLNCNPASIGSQHGKTDYTEQNCRGFWRIGASDVHQKSLAILAD